MKPAPLDEVMNRGPAKRAHKFKTPAPGEPWFTAPLARFTEMIDPFVIGIRTLPDTMLRAELEQLNAECAKPGRHIACRLMQRIFEAETARREDPAFQFDAELDTVLERLSRQTNDADRQRVTEIGQRLFEIGGSRSLQDAMKRALVAVKPEKQSSRLHILEKRWPSLWGKA